MKRSLMIQVEGTWERLSAMDINILYAKYHPVKQCGLLTKVRYLVNYGSCFIPETNVEIKANPIFRIIPEMSVL